MDQRRNTIGGALLVAATSSWIGGATVRAASEAGWCDRTVIGLFVAGGLCLVAAVVVLTGPHREPKPEKSAARQYAEQFLKEDGLWPSWWQRALHPRTPVGELPVRVPASLRETYRHRIDGLNGFIEELEAHQRDLGIQLVNGRTFGVFHAYNAWPKYSDILNAAAFAELLDPLQDAYSRTYVLNDKTRARYDAASHDDVNDPEWVRLTVRETQERTEALEAVEKALAGLRAARDSYL